MMFSFTPSGPELPVNTTTSDIQQNAAVASDGTGNFVVVWQSHNQDGDGWGIYGQRYSAAGSTLGSEFLINQTTAQDQTLPAIAMDSAGTFVVLWVSHPSGNDDVYARVFSASAIPQTNEFLVSTSSAGDQSDPSVAMDSSGNFVIAFDGQGPGDSSGIFTQAYLSNGNAQGGAVLVNSTTANTQHNPSVGMNASGSYVIAWTDQSSAQPKIKARLYGAGGVANGSEFLAGTSGNYQEDKAAAGMDASGKFAIAWAEQLPDPGKWDVLARRFDPAGNALDAVSLNVNTYTKDVQDQPSLAMRSDGHFLVAWESNKEDGNKLGVFAQAFNPDGSADGGEFQVNTTTQKSQELPSVAWNGGDAIVAWDGQLAFDDQGVAAQQLAGALSANQAPSPSVPGAQSLDQYSTLTFSSGGGNPIAVSDPDGGTGTEQVTLTATNGTIALQAGTNVSITAGTGTNDATVTLQGSLTDLNAAMNGMTFTPNGGFSGTASLAISVNDLGNSGTAIVVSDPGAPNTTATVVLTASSGTLSLGNPSQVFLNSGTGTNDGTVSFTGTIAAVNAALDGLVFAPTAHTFGSAGIGLTVSEGSNSVTANVPITVARVVHMPGVSNATTNENAQSNSGLVITPDPLDSGLNGFYQITGVTGGTLFQNDGTTPIANNSFITFAQGQAGLKFTPAANSTAGGSFSVQASTANSVERYSEDLEAKVRLRTVELELSRLQVVHCLARAAEYRDDTTGRHVIRVGRYASVLARELGFSQKEAATLGMAAQLHDVGKIGLPDSILLKPGALTPKEYETVKTHCDIGQHIVQPLSETEWKALRECSDIEFGIQTPSRDPLLVMIANITHSHHERWDGTGYPRGLRREQIPRESRITSVADVFDALMTRCPYKPALPLREVMEIMAKGRGTQFDPQVVDALSRCRNEALCVGDDEADRSARRRIGPAQAQSGT